jgi:fluoroquinolone transport system ATP-binding protein
LPSPRTPVIAVEDLRFTYRRARGPAVDGMSFTVEDGEVFGFLGPSGAGKSTTQRILIGLLRGWSGRAEVLGRDLPAWGRAYYERIGVSFELPNHFSKLTALENLRFFASLHAGARDPVELLEALGLAEHADKRVGGFSKGMRQRLNVGRALLHRPDLLFLDEPTSGLDPVTARLVKDLIRAEQARGATVFLTTHDMTAADELCDRVAFVVDGRLAAVDAPEDLRLARSERTVRVAYRGANGREESVFALDTLADDATFLALVRDGRIESLHSTEATLDDVFVDVTGRRLV